MTYCCFVLFRFFSHDSLLLLAGSCNRGRRSKSGTRGKTCTRWVGLENHYSSFFAINKVTKPSVRVQFWWSSFWLGTRHLSPAGGGSEDFGRVTIKWIWSLLWSSPPPLDRSLLKVNFLHNPPLYSVDDNRSPSISPENHVIPLEKKSSVCYPLTPPPR